MGDPEQSASDSHGESGIVAEAVWRRRVVIAFVLGFLLGGLSLGLFLTYLPSPNVRASSTDKVVVVEVASEATNTVVPESGELVQPLYRILHDTPVDCSTCHLPGHLMLAPCKDCHTSYKNGWVTVHPRYTNCSSCHSKPSDHYPGTCSICHRNTGSFRDVSYMHDSNAVCAGCHTPGHDDKGEDCSTCHPNLGTDWRFVHEDRLDCGSCHDRPENHYGYSCESCHVPPVADTPSWGIGCNVSGCHTSEPIDAHVPDAANDRCIGCHDAGNLAKIHLDAKQTAPDGTMHVSCLVCHDPSAQPITKDCAVCHADKGPDHGNLEIIHMSTPSDETVEVLGTVYGPLECSSCHALQIVTEHGRPTSSSVFKECTTCHPNPRQSFGAWEKGCVQSGCHGTIGAYPQHGEIDAAHTPLPENVNCAGSRCHGGDLASVHAGTAIEMPLEGTTKSSCMICHDDETVPTDKNCNSCHDGKTDADGDVVLHGFKAENHLANPADDHILFDSIDYGSFACDACHEMAIDVEHEKTTSSSTGQTCVNCHDLPRDSFETWDKGCVQGGCHTLATPQEQHVEAESDHQVTADEAASCETAGCHAGNRASLHLSAETTVGVEPRISCMVCHGDGVPASATCPDCHTVAHAEPDHTPGRASCQLSGCHDQTVEDTHGVCDRCHFQPTPLPDDTDCLNCHTIKTEHEAADALHTGDVTGSNWRSRWNPTCGGVGNYDFVGLCHDVANVMDLHVNMHDGSDGCPTCHDGAVAPTTTCVTCHQKNSAPANGVGLGFTSYMHHNNNKFVADQLEVAEGSYYTTAPVSGWDDTVTNYDCQFCHYNFFLWGGKPTPPEPRSPYAGDSMWYAGLRSVAGAAKDTTLGVGVFSATDSLELEYMVNYQTYAGYDYGYSEVTTDSVTWITVPGNITSADPVSSRHLGNGIEGDSGGWVRATFDLSAYAGQDIEVRLRYKTSYYGTSLFGYAVDDIVVRDASGTLFSNDAESADMPTMYWRRTGSYPPAYLPDDPNN